MDADHHGLMMLTLLVGWLILSVLLAAAWSRIIRNGQMAGSVPEDALPGSGLLPVPSPRRSREGMAESSW